MKKTKYTLRRQMARAMKFGQRYANSVQDAVSLNQDLLDEFWNENGGNDPQFDVDKEAYTRSLYRRALLGTLRKARDTAQDYETGIIDEAKAKRIFDTLKIDAAIALDKVNYGFDGVKNEGFDPVGKIEQIAKQAEEDRALLAREDN